jgi:hypothetical protein
LKISKQRHVLMVMSWFLNVNGQDVKDVVVQWFQHKHLGVLCRENPLTGMSLGCVSHRPQELFNALYSFTQNFQIGFI